MGHSVGMDLDSSDRIPWFGARPLGVVTSSKSWNQPMPQALLHPSVHHVAVAAGVTAGTLHEAYQNLGSQATELLPARSASLEALAALPDLS